MENFGLNQEIAGKPMMQYMADLLELNDNQQIEIERGKMAVAILKQMNNVSRLQQVILTKYNLLLKRWKNQNRNLQRKSQR